MGSQSLRVAVVAACPFPVPRGTPIRILRLAEAVAERGHEVHVATYHLGSGNVSPALKVHRIANVPGYRKLAPGPSPRKLLQADPALVRLLRRLLASQPFDVIHAHHVEGVAVAAAARWGGASRKIPLLFDAHTLLASELPYYSLGLPATVKVAFGRTLDRWLPRLAEHTACVTDTIRDRLVREAGADPARVTVVPNGIELAHFDPARASPRRAADGPILIFTGNLAEYQGIGFMLEAFQHVVRRVPEAKLVIATDSSLDPYEARAAALGIRDRIITVASPSFDELPGLLAGADVAINPRTNCDGIPVKLLNYMAAGKPAVSFDSAAPGVTHGHTGWLAPSGDVRALADGIIALMRDKPRAQAMGAAARSYVVANCNWGNSAEICERIYLGLRASTRAQSSDSR